MLRIYPVVLEVLRQLQPALQRIEVKDRDLGRQLRQLHRQLNSVVATLVRLVRA